MYKDTRTYTDFDGNERTEDFYFNLTKAEVFEMELSIDGGLGDRLDRIIKSKNVPAIIKTFKDLVLKAYGQKSPDGKRFIKNDALREEFEQCPAYSDIFMELATDADKASKFIIGIVPADMAEQVQASIASGQTN